MNNFGKSLFLKIFSRKIFDLLKEQDLTAGENADHFQISKPSISSHLRILKEAELVIDDKKGSVYLLLV
jgi:DNA-binding transcriptional ArsR family regulator